MWVLAASAALAIWSPVYLGVRDVHALGSPTVSAKSHAVGLIPHGVPVSATNQLGGHLSERRYIYTFPAVGRARWLVLDRHDPTEADIAGFKTDVRKYESSKAWRIVFASHGIFVLHKAN
jgi:hypothetical protein